MEIRKPTLLVDLKKVERNIKGMANKFREKNVSFRPHFKTHQSRFIGEYFKKVGINKCTVSSLGMAAYFAANGWKDICIAFPANVLEIKEMNDLASRIQLQLLVDSVEKVNLLGKGIRAKAHLFIEIDTGYFRSGIMFDALSEIEKIIQAIEAFPQFKFVGFLSHTGNTYAQQSTDEISTLFNLSKQKLIDLKLRFLSRFPNLIVSMGDTPAASLVDDFSGIDEMRPGNFVFYDVMQYFLGSCKIDDIAVALYCPVVAKYPERNQIVIYGGGVHLSKEKINSNGQAIHGLISKPNKAGFGELIPNCFVESLSQEHGIIHMSAHEMEHIRLGDLLAVYPIHSCMTVDLNKQMISLSGVEIPKYRTF